VAVNYILRLTIRGFSLWAGFLKPNPLPESEGWLYINVHWHCAYVYTGCPRRNVRHFGKVFLILNYTDITQNTYIQSWTVTEIMAREFWNFDSCYSLIDYQTHIETGRNMRFLVMLIAVRNIKVTCEWHKAIKLIYKNTRTRVIVVLRLISTLRRPQLICYLVTSELPCAVAHTPRSLHYNV